MHPSFTRIFKLVLPAAFAAAALTLSQHSPARADSAPQSQVCGPVDLGSANGADSTLAFDCFRNAFSSCQPATLVASGQDAGVSTTWTFSTVDGGDDHGCSVSETVEKHNAASKTTDAYRCRTVSRDKDGLHFTGCGSQRNVSLRVNASAGATAPVAQQSTPAKN